MSINLVGSTYGSLYIATLLSTAFYGVTCMQTFFYYVHYQNDLLRVKFFVVILWALNTVQEALTVFGAYKFILTGLLNPGQPPSPTGNSELILLYLFTALVALPTQGFFVYRIYVFSGRNKITPLIWVILALIQLACDAVYTERALSIPNANGSAQILKENILNPSYQLLGTLYLSIGAGVDILVAICMTFLLVRERATTDFASTAHILQRLAIFSVNTGIWTATFALLSIILLHLFPSNLIYAVFTIPLCPMYCNALLANLNARTYLGSDGKVYNTDTEWFMTSSCSRQSDELKDDQQRGETNPFPSDPSHIKIWQTVEVVQFRDANQSIVESE